jgi:hypothetical protein
VRSVGRDVEPHETPAGERRCRRSRGILSCGLQDLPQFLDALDHAEGFDAIVSNFGALNCAPSLDALGVIGGATFVPAARWRSA